MQTADTIMDRLRLKRHVTLWRSLAIVILLVLMFVFASKEGVNIPQEHIARITIDGIILEDPLRDKIIKDLKNDEYVKAVVVYVNSPGGTIVGGENLYYTIKDLAATKPVVTVMGSLAASGGYMASIAADKIFARAGTVTGSIGVLLQSFDVTGLGEKVGVNFITFKSGKLKASPSPFEKLDPETAAVINSSIEDSFQTFLNMVVERRGLTEHEINKIKDGRIFTGRQALGIKLIDEIGGEEEALAWLEKERSINKNLKIIDVKLDSEKEFVEKLLSKITGGSATLAVNPGGGLLALWRPSAL